MLLQKKHLVADHAQPPVSIPDSSPEFSASITRSPLKINPKFSYEQAFSRNVGILTAKEQSILRKSRVALAGVGGVGGFYAEALARMGIGNFTIADGDTFEVANFNRQMGGTLGSVGCNKARTMEQRIHSINPEANVTVWEKHLDEGNTAEFLTDANVVVDAIEAFVIEPHRFLHRETRARNLTTILGAPLGFSAAVLVFGKDGMKADDYFDWYDGQEKMEQVANLILGLAPAGLHVGVVDLQYVNLEKQVGPSNIAACLLCAGIVATEVARQLLDRPGARYAPAYLQFDAISQRIKRGRLKSGNRNIKQRIRRWFLLREYRKLHSKGQALKPNTRPA